MSTTNVSLVNVYHFYRDFLFHFGNYIDLQCGGVFRKIETNIQGRTFLYKDFSQELKLPALFIQCSSMISRIEKNNPIYTNQAYGPNEVFSTVLLLNETKNEYIITTNQFFQFTLDLTINTNTQLEALEIIQYINQIFPPNTTFQWEGFNTFIPIYPDLLEDWDLTNDEIYYLYEQRLTSQELEPIINNNVYYGLFEVKPLITSSSSSTYPTDYTNTTQASASFIVNTFVPVLMYRNTIPNEITRIVYNINSTLEPISSTTIDTLNNIQEATNFKFIKGIILDYNILSYDDTNNQYIIDLSSVYVTDPNQVLFLIRFPDLSYLYTLDNKIQVLEYDSDNNILKYKIESKFVSDYQKDIFDKVINKELSIDSAFFEKE
jgi:hypothetical protein